MKRHPARRTPYPRPIIISGLGHSELGCLTGGIVEYSLAPTCCMCEGDLDASEKSNCVPTGVGHRLGEGRAVAGLCAGWIA